MNHRYRIHVHAWLLGVLGWSICALFGYLLGVYLGDSRFWLLALLALGMATWRTIEGLLTWVELDHEGIGGRWKGRRYFLPWRMARAVWVDGEGTPTPVLRLGTDNGVISLLLQDLPSAEILRMIRLRLPPAIQGGAAQNEYLDQHHKAYQEITPEVHLPLQLGYNRGMLVLFILGVVFWGWMIFISWISADAGRWVGITCFSAFLLLTLFALVLITQRIRMDSEGISDLSLFGHFRMDWTEIEHVWIGPRGQAMLIEGHGKRLAVQGPAGWKGHVGQQARYYFMTKLEALGINPQTDHWLEMKVIFSSRSARQSAK